MFSFFKQEKEKLTKEETHEAMIGLLVYTSPYGENSFEDFIKNNEESINKFIELTEDYEFTGPFITYHVYDYVYSKEFAAYINERVGYKFITKMIMTYKFTDDDDCFCDKTLYIFFKNNEFKEPTGSFSEIETIFQQ